MEKNRGEEEITSGMLRVTEMTYREGHHNCVPNLARSDGECKSTGKDNGEGNGERVPSSRPTTA